jgi:hypothetical protein
MTNTYYPEGKKFDNEGNEIDYNYGVTNWDLYGLVIFNIITY